MLKILTIKFIPMRQQSRQRNSVFCSRFTSNLMLPTCLLRMLLVGNAVCSSKIASNFSTLNISQEIGQERMPRGGGGGGGDFGGLTSCAIIM